MPGLVRTSILASSFAAALTCHVAFPTGVLAQRDTSPFLESAVVSGAVIGGLGAILNRDSTESWTTALWRGMSAGALGGWLQYQGKRQALKMSTRDHLEYAWLARTLHAAGTSVIENAAASRGPFESFRFNVGFVRFDLDTRTRQVRSRLLPAALVGAIHVAQWGHLDAKRSLRTGILTFRARSSDDHVRGLAVTRVNTVLYAPWATEFILSEVLAHELVHTLQYDDYAGATMLLKPLVGFAEDWSVAKLGARWVYPDVHAGIDALRYEVLYGGQKTCANPLEREAYRFTARYFGFC